MEKDPIKPNLTSSASVKGKKDIARSKEHQKSFRILERTNASSSVQSNKYPSSSVQSKPATGGGPDIGYQFRGAEQSKSSSRKGLGQSRIGRGGESVLSADGEERQKRNGKSDSTEKGSVHEGVNGSIRRDGDVRDEVVRNTEEAEMLDGEQGNHHVESDVSIQGIPHSQNHAGRNDGLLENLCDNAAGKDDRMLLEEDEGSQAF